MENSFAKYIEISVNKQIHPLCNMCDCKINDISGLESSSEVIDGFIYWGVQTKGKKIKTYIIK